VADGPVYGRKTTLSGAWGRGGGRWAQVAPRPRMVLASIDRFHERGGTQVTKAELVDQVADRADLTKQDAGRAVDAVLATVEDALRRGSEVTVAGFGKFHVSDRGARMGVNPRTGERIQIAASRVPRFTAGSGLKSAVKGR
jgi:DNA-binding protein HU-beta